MVCGKTCRFSTFDFYADDRGFDPHQRWPTGLLC